MTSLSNNMYLGSTFDEKKYLELETEATKNHMLDEMAHEDDTEVSRRPFLRFAKKIPPGFKKVVKKIKLAVLQIKPRRDTENPSVDDGSNIVQVSCFLNESESVQNVIPETDPDSSLMKGVLKSVLPEEAVSRGISTVTNILPLISRSSADIPAAGNEYEVARPSSIIREYEPVQSLSLEFVSISSPPKESRYPILHKDLESSTEEWTGSIPGDRETAVVLSISKSLEDASRESQLSRANPEANMFEEFPAEEYVCYEDDGPRRVKCLGPCEDPKPYVQRGTVKRLATLLKPLWAGKVISDEPQSDLNTDSAKKVRANSSVPRVELLLRNQLSSVAGFSAEA